MQAGGREPSMEDILASIKRVIAEDKDARASEPAPQPPQDSAVQDEEDVLELSEPLAPATDLGPPLLEESVADATRQSLEQLSNVAASAPPSSQNNPLEEIVREMLRPVLKQWLDEHLPSIVEEHVRREISRITGRKL
jgi:cell pole-organizing protein PopZ